MGDLISRQEAIETSLEFFVEYLGGAFDENGQKELMARLQRLPSAQPKKTVDNYIESLPTSPLLVGKMPSVQPEIIRCKDCVYWDSSGYCVDFMTQDENGFCSWAKRRTDE